MKRTVVALLSVMVAAVIGLSGCSGQNTQESSSTSSDMSRTTVHGLTLSYPDSWEVDDSDDESAYLVTKDDSDKSTINVTYEGNFSTSSDEAEDDFDESVKEVENAYGSNNTWLKLDESNSSNDLSGMTDGVGTIKTSVSVSGTAETESGKKIKTKGTLFIAAYYSGEGDSDVYDVLVMGPDDDFDNREQEINEVLNSITLDEYVGDTGEDDSYTDETADKESDEETDTDSYTSGTYKVGSDIRAGEYKLTAEDAGYYCVYPNTKKKDIVGNENFTTSTYVTLKKGQCFELSDASCVLAKKADASSSKTLSGDGKYKVGTDCPAGEYKLTADDGSLGGYYCIYDSSNPDAEIVSNNNFESKDYCQVSKGQYLELSGCTAKLS